ncbi:hypothetical protein VT84_07590 [Gemmata sp. SH-PL17]|uniref:hypothetical protein n=1 Tax=Gemmata sp. SH-PL17 TaxID=1630693 RepID=UPI00078E7162|nr:hypothetical protein [Gemmata sp. SH-PL17]AMV24243.1 hypothetical protein VT84_07590 [Gemmata sp. SH-PL17]
MTIDPDRAEAVAATVAACGTHQLANWFPADRHDELHELLYDLSYTAILTYLEAETWRTADPSAN